MRDAVWAAALSLALTDFSHWVDRGSDLDLELRARQEGYAQTDPWHDLVLDYCAGRESVKAADVFRIAICRGSLDWAQRFDRKAAARVGDTMRRLGCVPGERERARVYLVPASLRDAPPTPGEVQRRVREEGSSLRAVSG